MASNINANNIDGFYPVAGQDNDSQGFRDNFTNTRTNFQFAADEITDLQNKTILKAPLAGGGNIEVINNMAGSPLIDFEARDVSYTFENLGSVSGSQTINYELGQYQQVTPTDALSLSFSNFPAAGIAGEVTVLINLSPQVYPVRFVSNQSWENVEILGLAKIDNTTYEFTAPTTGRYVFTVYANNGTNGILRISESNSQLQPFNNSVEVANIAVSNVVSVGTTVSVFDTTDGNIAALAAGVDGQVKILAAANVAAGNLEVTVSDPAWTGSGTVEFYGQGQTATFYYANSKWFCIGTGPDATGNIPVFS
jgi:hypothetical protein